MQFFLLAMGDWPDIYVDGRTKVGRSCEMNVQIPGSAAQGISRLQFELADSRLRLKRGTLNTESHYLSIIVRGRNATLCKSRGKTIKLTSKAHRLKVGDEIFCGPMVWRVVLDYPSMDALYAKFPFMPSYTPRVPFEKPSGGGASLSRFDWFKEKMKDLRPKIPLVEEAPLLEMTFLCTKDTKAFYLRWVFKETRCQTTTLFYEGPSQGMKKELKKRWQFSAGSEKYVDQFCHWHSEVFGGREITQKPPWLKGKYALPPTCVLKKFCVTYAQDERFFEEVIPFASIERMNLDNLKRAAFLTWLKGRLSTKQGHGPEGLARISEGFYEILLGNMWRKVDPAIRQKVNLPNPKGLRAKLDDMSLDQSEFPDPYTGAVWHELQYGVRNPEIIEYRFTNEHEIKHREKLLVVPQLKFNHIYSKLSKKDKETVLGLATEENRKRQPRQVQRSSFRRKKRRKKTALALPEVSLQTDTFLADHLAACEFNLGV